MRKKALCIQDRSSTYINFYNCSNTLLIKMKLVYQSLLDQAEKQLNTTFSLRPPETKNSLLSRRRNGGGSDFSIDLLPDSDTVFDPSLAIAAAFFSVLRRATYSSGMNTSITVSMPVYIQGEKRKCGNN